MAGQPAPILYKLLADATGFRKGTRDAEKSLRDLDQQAGRTDRALDLKATVDDSALAALRVRLLETRASLRQDIETKVDLDASQALRDLQRIERQIRQIDRMDARPEVNVDRDGRAKRALDGLDKASDALLRKIPYVGPALAEIGPAGWLAAAGIAGVTSGLGYLVAMPLLATGGTAGGLLGAKSLLEAFDTLDKAGRKAEIVFGKNLADVQAWAEGLSTNVGLGTVDITSMAASIQDLLVPQGFERGEAAKVTQDLYERGAALAEFNGVETSQGVEAVTAAMLGQRKQLKGLGVDITAKEVKERVALLRGQASYRGYTDKMLQTVATQGLLEEKSEDAWTAFTEGGSAADNALDTLNATLANLRTDAIEGFGGILNDILQDLGAINGGMGEFGSLGDWIAANGEKIRGAFLDVAEFIAQSVVSMTQFGGALAQAVVGTAPLVAGMVRLMAGMASDAQEVAGAMLMIAPATRGTGIAMLKSAGSTKQLGDSAATAYENLINAVGPDVIKGLESVEGGAQGVLTKIQELQALDATRLKVTAELKSGNLAQAKADLRKLTRPQLVALLSTLDPKSKDSAERKLRSLAKDRIAKIDAKAERKRADEDMASLTKPKEVTVTPKVEIPEGGAWPGAGTGFNFTASITPTLGSTTQTETDLTALAKERKVKLKTELKGKAAVKTELDKLDDARYVHIYGIYHAPGSAPSDSTGGGGTGGGGTGIGAIQINRFAYAGGVEPMAAGYYKTTLQPQSREQVQVNVHLDSKRIASYLTTASGRRP